MKSFPSSPNLRPRLVLALRHAVIEKGVHMSETKLEVTSNVIGVNEFKPLKKMQAMSRKIFLISNHFTIVTLMFWSAYYAIPTAALTPPIF